MKKGDWDDDMVRLKHAQAMTHELFSLQEPWRERFLVVVAGMAQGNGPAATIPSRDQVQQWLTQDADLCHDVACLVRSWSGNLE